MSRVFRWRPRRALPLAWLLVLLCCLCLPVTTAGARPARQYRVRHAELTLSVADAERTARALEELARTVRGRFVEDRIQVFVSAGGRRRVEATLELPPELLDTALARLEGLALAVMQKQVENRDVSSQVAELNRHLGQLRAIRRELGDLLEQATTASERRRVETALAEAEGQVAEAEARLSALRQEADWAVIRLVAHEAPATPTPTPLPTRTPVPVTPSPTPWHPAETAAQATGVLFSVLRGLTEVLIVVAIVGGPFLVLAAIGLIWLRFKRRQS